LSDILKPILNEGTAHNYAFDVEALVRKIVPAVEVVLKKFNTQPPTCIRCGEQPSLTAKIIEVKVSPQVHGVYVLKNPHDAPYDSPLQFNTAGWRTFDGGEHEALCPECLGFVKTIGKDGGA